MTGDGRPTMKDYIDQAVNGIEKVFGTQLKASEERLINIVGDTISHHQKSCDANRIISESKRRDQIIISKKYIVGYITGLVAVITALIELIRQVLGG